MNIRNGLYTGISIVATVVIAGFYFYSKGIDINNIEPANTESEPTCNIDRGDYLMREVYGGVPAALDIRSGEPAFMTKGTIEKGYGETNFAGHYSVVTWSCGGNCQESAIVDVKTGKVAHFKLISQYGISVCQNNRVITVNPPDKLEELEKIPRNVRTSYYEMRDDGQLSLLCEEK